MPPRIRRTLVELDLLDPRRVSAGKPLSSHLEDFRRSLEAKGSTAKHVKLLTNRVERLVSDCGFRYWSDISAGAIETHLHTRRQEARFSAQSFNFYLQAIKQFCSWMVRERRATESPVGHLRGVTVRTDRRHDRRALSADEMQWLVETVHASQERKGKTWSLSGPERAMLYRLAMETGFRLSELRSLTPSSLRLDCEEPVVTVKAAYSKRADGKRKLTLLFIES